MTLSIVVPIYNTEGYLRRCFDSIISNDTDEYEVILVNDGSTDGSRSICEQFVARYPKKFRLFNKENGGLSSARNFGVRHGANGTYILFLDPDDYLEVGFLDRICAMLSRKDRAELYEFGFEIHQKDGESRLSLPSVYVSVDSPIRGEEYLKRVYKKAGTYPMCVWKYIIERDFFEKEGLSFKEGRNYEDVLLVPPMVLKCKKICTIYRVEYHYTSGRPGSITQTFSLQNELDRLYAASRSIRLFDRMKDKELKTLAQNAFSKTYYSVLPSLFVEKDRKKKKILEQELLRKKGMINYTCSGKHMILKYVVKLYGIHFCGFLLYVRRKWKRAEEILFGKIWGR